MENKKRIKLLIISGGGIFGIIPARFLMEVEDLLEQNPITHFSGTSIGGVAVLYLASGGKPKDFLEIFKKNSEKIFKPRFIKKVCPLWRGPKYNSNNIEKFLQEYLPGKMGDLKAKVVVPSINFRLEVPRIFHNLKDSVDLNYDVWKVARSTSAAPYYFDPYGQDVMIDGGLIENVPLITAITKLKSKEGVRLEDMDVLIVGTGMKDVEDKTLSTVQKYWPWEWGTKMLLPFTTKANEIASEHWGYDLGLHYFNYFNPVMINGSLDDTSLATSGILEDCCESYLGQFRQEFERFINA